MAVSSSSLCLHRAMSTTTSSRKKRQASLPWLRSHWRRKVKEERQWVCKPQHLITRVLGEEPLYCLVPFYSDTRVVC